MVVYGIELQGDNIHVILSIFQQFSCYRFRLQTVSHIITIWAGCVRWETTTRRDHTDLCPVTGFVVPVQNRVDERAQAVSEHAVIVSQLEKPRPKSFTRHGGGWAAELTEREI